MRERFNASEWLLDRHIDEGRGDAVAVRTLGRSYTYADVLSEVQAAAGALRSLGVRPEERLAMVMLDSIEFVATFLGAMRIGAVPVPINPLLPGRDLGVIVADSRARALVVSGDRASVIAELFAGAPEIEHVITTGVAHVENANGAADMMPWAEFVGAKSDGSAFETWEESPGFWLCTSGSTGQPKLAMHSHVDLRVTHETYGEQVLGITSGDICFSVGPMFHAYGLGNSLTFPFAVGATVVLEPTRPPTPQLVADIVSAEKPTLFFCVPAFYAALNGADLPDDAFASVRFGVSAAEPLPADTFERFRDKYGVTILDGIGSTEMLHIYLSNNPEQHRGGTSGVPVPGYEVRVVDENGEDQPTGEPGQLLVRGDSVASGYWCRGDQSRAAFRGDWTHTGDLYERSADGFHTYLGRVDDMLRVGGEWVSPAEVEGVLIEHAGVLEAAVVGERDESGVLRPIAHVIAATGANPSNDELVEWCRDRLAGYKRPKRYELVENLPKTATGKIQRYKLRDA